MSFQYLSNLVFLSLFFGATSWEMPFILWRHDCSVSMISCLLNVIQCNSILYICHMKYEHRSVALYVVVVISSAHHRFVRFVYPYCSRLPCWHLSETDLSLKRRKLLLLTCPNRDYPGVTNNCFNNYDWHIMNLIRDMWSDILTTYYRDQWVMPIWRMHSYLEMMI